ncbi:hypothetical protein GSI_13524 [Ganoderma sinense ZZ0214-1]|uniref:Transporter n=1 Tax=Ganoderma sinense ZZ0214-1 TaxID=1077348 RepID=A0A2G8RQI4_9APHY|nr:hypothetical protein GSI_13524 [Ganoderma sinense ZZ0214-1]
MTASVILVLCLEVFGIGIQRDFNKLFQSCLNVVPSVQSDIDTALAFEQELDVGHATTGNV